ncbi:MAG TPA: hypothetical protein VK528_13175, partial [Flavobacterium sp.]|nr:hypothetical protein [Flavobacterium sp.]
PFQPLEKSNAAEAKEENTNLANNAGNSKNLSVETDKKTYSKREKVDLKIRNTIPIKGNFSLSVRKTDDLPSNNSPDAMQFSPNRAWTPNATAALPELRGELISGTIVSKKGAKDLGNKTVALSIPGKSFAFKLVKTNRAGKFMFLLDKNPSASAAVIQVMEENRNDYSILLDEGITADLSALQFRPELQLSPVYKTTIEQRSIANQIENAYYERKKDSLSANPATEPFFHPLEKQYVLDDYTRFPTLRETITEVVLEMYSKKNGSKYSIHLRNNTMDPEVYGMPLVLVDGLLVQDTNEIYDYGANNIYKVSLINEPYVYGPRTFSGVANFTTINNDYETKATGDFIKKVEIPRPSVRKQYFNPQYTSADTNSRIPDYRQQLLWQPEITLRNNDNTLSFYTSDISGKFEIVLEGFSENGDPVSIKDFIEVK